MALYCKLEPGISGRTAEFLSGQPGVDAPPLGELAHEMWDQWINDVIENGHTLLRVRTHEPTNPLNRAAL